MATKLIAYVALAIAIMTPASALAYACNEVTGRALYVATNGSDSNSGSSSSPLRTIQAAASRATPGTTVVVRDGTYAGGFETTVSGTAAAPIIFTSQNRNGATILDMGVATKSSAAGWHNRGSNVVIQCFSIRSKSAGASWRIGFYTDGSNVIFRLNRVSDILRDPVLYRASTQGGAGIETDHYRLGVNDHVIQNTVYNIGPDGVRSSLVHGIYAATSGIIFQNYIQNIVGAGIHQWHDSGYNQILSNTIINARSCGILIGSGDYYHPGTWGDYNVVQDNRITTSPYGISWVGHVGTHNTYLYNSYIR